MKRILRLLLQFLHIYIKLHSVIEFESIWTRPGNEITDTRTPIRPTEIRLLRCDKGGLESDYWDTTYNHQIEIK